MSVVINDLSLDLYAGREKPGDGALSLVASGVARGQRAGVWEILGRAAPNEYGWHPECDQLFKMEFPLGEPRPLPTDVSRATEYCAKNGASQLCSEWSATASTLRSIKNAFSRA